MNARPIFRAVALQELAGLRERYLDELPKAQEALVEVLVQGGDTFAIELHGEVVGYFVVHGGDTLVEFYLTPEHVPVAHVVFLRFLAEKKITRALVKSFDYLFLACSMDSQVSVRSKGVLVRDFVRRELPVIDRIRYTQRQAEEADFDRVRAVEQDVFTHPERLLAVIRRGAMRLFERDDALLGFGIIRPIIPGRPDVDLGIAVDVPFRNKGYAVYMLRDMVDYCFSTGLNPVTGCAKENEASIRMGLRVGFQSRYRLLEVGFNFERSIVSVAIT